MQSAWKHFFKTIRGGGKQISFSLCCFCLEIVSLFSAQCNKLLENVSSYSHVFLFKGRCLCDWSLEMKISQLIGKVFDKFDGFEQSSQDVFSALHLFSHHQFLAHWVSPFKTVYLCGKEAIAEISYCCSLFFLFFAAFNSEKEQNEVKQVDEIKRTFLSLVNSLISSFAFPVHGGTHFLLLSFVWHGAAKNRK